MLADNEYWVSSCGRIELRITADQAAQGYHSGDCYDDITALRARPEIAEQLATLDPGTVAEYLQGFVAWDETELADHSENLGRLLWLACGDLEDVL